MTHTPEFEVRRSSVSEILDSPQWPSLLAEYSRECSVPLIGAIDPQRGMYDLLESAGLFHPSGVFERGKLVGFSNVLQSILPHYGKKAASVESLFVSFDHRVGGVGGLLMDQVEASAAANGCETVIYTAPVNSRLARLLFLSSDRYTNTHHVFCRRLL